ncbi:hypothetical protein [Paraburkholderia acidipaludis]|uniref:hypothetical protein n=1 Tax=Paraburkholderia acidipaludis TaxID=660537 RepID=UPI000AE9FD0E|nr:hypothetical protein [Paraburkholderia acidipaludis]
MNRLTHTAVLSTCNSVAVNDASGESLLVHPFSAFWSIAIARLSPVTGAIAQFLAPRPALRVFELAVVLPEAVAALERLSPD